MSRKNDVYFFCLVTIFLTTATNCFAMKQKVIEKRAPATSAIIRLRNLEKRLVTVFWCEWNSHEKNIEQCIGVLNPGESRMIRALRGNPPIQGSSSGQYLEGPHILRNGNTVMIPTLKKINFCSFTRKGLSFFQFK